MKYNETTPCTGYTSEYTHTIYYGEGAFEQLAEDVQFLIRRNPTDSVSREGPVPNSNSRARDAGFWRRHWDSDCDNVRKQLSQRGGRNGPARAVIVRHVGSDGSGSSSRLNYPDWNALWIVTKPGSGEKPDESDCYMICNDWATYFAPGSDEQRTALSNDLSYLKTLNVFANFPGAASPGINTRPSPAVVRPVPASAPANRLQRVA